MSDELNVSKRRQQPNVSNVADTVNEQKLQNRPLYSTAQKPPVTFPTKVLIPTATALPGLLY